MAQMRREYGRPVRACFKPEIRFEAVKQDRWEEGWLPVETEIWLEPDVALEAREGVDSVLSTSQVAQWREQGFALVDGVLPASLLSVARETADGCFVPAGSPDAVRDFGSGGRMEFPTGHPSLDAITLHPRILHACAQLLSIPARELRLTQSDVWAKYGHSEKNGDERSNDDQRIHMDYPNHYITHPPAWHQPEAVEMIVYLDDVISCGGATALVARQGDDDVAYRMPYVAMPGVGSLGWINDRSAAEAGLEREAPEVAAFRRSHLYSREARARFVPGTILFYRHDLWHRGTWLKPGTRRLAQNLTFCRAGADWIHPVQAGSAWRMYRADQSTERLIAQATVDQRCVLGFPAPGHPHWTPERIEAVRARYEPLGMDMTPYQDSVSGGGGTS